MNPRHHEERQHVARSRCCPTVLVAADDEEVSPARCTDVADRSHEAGRPINVTTYPGATHGFDAPLASRQATGGNAPAMSDALSRAGPLVDGWLRK